MKKAQDLLFKIFDNIMFISSALVALLVVIGAIMRYILKLDFYGSEEIILLIGFWMYFAGSAVASYEGSHISADLISTFIKSKKNRKILYIIQELISIVLYGVLTWYALRFLKFSIDVGQKTPVYKIPMIAQYLIVLISFIMATIYSSYHFYKNLKEYKEIKGV